MYLTRQKGMMQTKKTNQISMLTLFPKLNQPRETQGLQLIPFKSLSSKQRRKMKKLYTILILKNLLV